MLSRLATREATRIYHVYKKQSRIVSLVVKKKLVKHQKVSKYYENDCLQNFLLLFRSLLTAKFVKKSHI